MLHRTLIGLVLCALASSTSPANAGPTIALSSPDNLSALTVGQTVKINVTLSGLPANDFIFNLNTRVLFGNLFTPVPDATSLSGLTASVASGSVFDDLAHGSAKIANFNYQGVKPDGLADSSLTAGAATGIFSEYPDSSTGAISLNGLYYSFLLKATSVGSGLIGFDPTSGANEYTADDTGFNYAPLPTSASLAFTILPTVSAPEPSSIVLCGMAGLFGAAFAWRSRKPAARDRPRA